MMNISSARANWVERIPLSVYRQGPSRLLTEDDDPRHIRHGPAWPGHQSKVMAGTRSTCLRTDLGGPLTRAMTIKVSGRDFGAVERLAP